MSQLSFPFLPAVVAKCFSNNYQNTSFLCFEVFYSLVVVFAVVVSLIAIIITAITNVTELILVVLMLMMLLLYDKS